MNEKKQTKKALIMSITSMVLCVAMLVGMTFAWFTDTASTAVNKIQAGNLDVALQMKDSNGKWVSAEGSTLTFKTADNRAADKILWEPGCTYELPELRVVNNGNLALKYKIVITGINGDAELNKVIDWTIGDVALGTEQALAVGASNEFKIKGHMQESAGNEYMNKSIEGIAITVYATQDTVESDSIDNTYDKNAQYPAVQVGTQTKLADAISDGKTNLALTAGEYTLYNVDNSKTQNTTLTLTGEGADKTVFSVGKPVADQPGEYNADYSYENSDVTFKNMTINVGTGNYKGIVRANSLYFENCTIQGMGSYWGIGDVTFKNCVFTDNGGYNLWTYSGKDFTFDGCTFNSSIGKFVNAYKEKRVDAKLDFKNCNFNYTGTAEAEKPAVCLKSFTGMIWNATFNGCTSNAKTDGATGSNLYSIESGMNAATTVTIDGKVVWENNTKK